MITESEISAGLFDDVVAELKDYEKNIQQADGLIWRRLTEAQKKCMVDFRCKRITYNLYLWPGKREYTLDDWIMEIAPNVKVNREAFVPQYTMPSGTISEDRKIIIHNYAEIEDGDILILTVYRMPIDEVINRANKPLIPAIYHPHLVDYVLSFYRKHNEEFKTREEVEKEIKLTRNRMLGIDSTMFYPSGFLKF